MSNLVSSSGQLRSGARRQSGPDRYPVWQVRPMKQEDIAKCLQIWLQVELTEAFGTVASTLASDPQGFYVAELDGQVIGMCAGPMTREDTAFMGFYAVEPRYQGIGVGKELWAKTVERLGNATNIGLYGVPSMSEKYKKSGFRVEDSVRMLIYESTHSIGEDGRKRHEIYPELLKSLDELDLNITSFGEQKWLLLSGRKIDNLNQSKLFEQLVEYDSHVNMFSREKLLSKYLLGKNAPLTIIILKANANACAQSADDGASGCKIDAVHGGSPSDQSQADRSGLINSSEETTLDAELSSNVQSNLTIGQMTQRDASYDMQIIGYGCIRHDNTNGGMIGPLYADSDKYCEVILRQLIQHFPMQMGGKFSVMSLTSNPMAGEILERIGLRQMDQCTRMFTKFIPQALTSKVYYVHSPNFTLF